MTAWLIYLREAADYNRQYIQFYKEEGKKLGIDVRLILIEDLELGVRNNTWFLEYQKKEIASPDFVICRAIYPLLSKHLELMGIEVFNNSFVSEICNDKARTYQYLAKTGIKMVDSSFYMNDQLKDILKHLEGRTVIKAVEGHGGSQVFLIDPKEMAFKDKNYINTESDAHKTDYGITKYNEVIDSLKCSDVVAQPLIGSRHQDLRVYVIGKEIIAAVLRTAREGFKSNFSLGGTVCLYQLSEAEKALVKIIIDQFEFGLVGIDFIIGDEGEFIFNEIEDVVGSRMLYQCSDINIVELYLKHIINKIAELT